MPTAQMSLAGIPEEPAITPAKSAKPAPVRNISEGTLMQHAKSCRDRFLHSALPPMVKANKTLTKRLIIYHIALNAKTPRETLQQFDTQTNVNADHHLSEHAKYNIIKSVPEDRLNEMMIHILIEGLKETIPDVLLEAAPDAGIDMLKDLGPDETWLNTLTKDDLLAYAAACNVSLGKLAKTGKKKEIVEAIAKEDLRGKLPNVLRMVCGANNE